MTKKLVLDTEKTVQQTLSDLARLFKDMSIEEWVPLPDDTGPGYTIKFMWNKKWVPVASKLQPTKAGNIRMCYRGYQNFQLALRFFSFAFAALGIGDFS
jgi:hypothetical protein